MLEDEEVDMPEPDTYWEQKLPIEYEDWYKCDATMIRKEKPRLLQVFSKRDKRVEKEINKGVEKEGG